MAPKRSHNSSSRASCELNRVEEWVSSVSNKVALNQLVVDGVLLDRVMAGWHPARGKSFPTPCGDELVVFEDYFYHGFGVSIHPFLCGLIEYYAISLCNLGLYSMSQNRPIYKSTSTKTITETIKFSHLSPYKPGSQLKPRRFLNQLAYNQDYSNSQVVCK